MDGMINMTNVITLLKNHLGKDCQTAMLNQQPEELVPTKEESVILSRVLAALRQIRYGHVQIVVQDSRVVQIDRTERERLT
jgi:hypothetical protein